MHTDWPELLLIDKPEGISSFDVIRRLRKIYTEKTGERAPKLGHAGTLDPAASGLMLIGVGQGTKKLQEYIKLDKEYVAEILLGRSTTTGDREGEVLEEADASGVSEKQVREVLAGMTGSLRLPVSAYSAIKKDGIPMYKRAREAAKIGELVKDVPWRDMQVYEAELLDMITIAVNSDSSSQRRCVEDVEHVHGVEGVASDKDYGGGKRKSQQTLVKVEVRFLVGSGTYVRSLGEELGRRLGLPASLAALRRTTVGPFDIKKAHQLVDV